MNGRQDLKTSGGMHISGGEYNDVRVSGALKVDGTLDCETLHASGAVKVAGDLHCAGRLAASGAVKVEGSVSGGSIGSSGALVAGRELTVQGELHTSGSVSCTGKLQADSLKTSGSCQCGGDVHVRELVSSGRLTVDGGVEAERFSSTGKVEIRGLLNAEEIDLRICADNTVGDIGGSKITVCKDWNGFSFHKPRLTVKSIEGDTVELELTKAEVVRARFIHIGPGCEITRVEYTEDLTIEGGTVTEQVKV